MQLAVEHETDPDEINRICQEQFIWCGHSGLNLQPQDYCFIVDLAFSIDNIVLWSHFFERHQSHLEKEKRGPNQLRRSMRVHASQKPAFMQEWARKNRETKSLECKQRRRKLRSKRRNERRNKRQAKIHKANIKFFRENRKLVENGNHRNSLVYFAKLVLLKPSQIEAKVGDVSLVSNALRNSFEFIGPEVPSLQKMAQLHCKSKYSYVSNVLYAACLETIRSAGTLDSVNLRLLSVLRTNIDMPYEAVSVKERTELKVEVERLLFPTSEEVEKFIREYIEPQLNTIGCNHPQVHWLKSEEPFKLFQKTLPVEWLRRFHKLPLHALDKLFELAAEFGRRKELEEIISTRCMEIMSDYPDCTDDSEIEKVRTFWLVRAFYFLPEMRNDYWDWLKADKNTVLKLNERSGGMYGNSYQYWPVFSAQKVEAILNGFIDVWPSVELSGSWGSESPAGEKAYRFLSGVIWKIGEDNPDNSLPVLDRLITDTRFAEFVQSLRSIRTTAVREKTLRDFEAPSPKGIVALLDKGEVATVEGLRALLLQELHDYQADLCGSDTTSKDIFYEKGERLGEVPATKRIADRMKLRLESKGITIILEHQLKDSYRCDFTCTKTIGGQRRLLVIEVKGQWHRELYTAASGQLHERYSIDPDAEQQGIYLVLWFGVTEKVAGKRNTELQNAQDLKKNIENTMPNELRGLIDVFVLDLSRVI